MHLIRFLQVSRQIRTSLTKATSNQGNISGQESQPKKEYKWIATMNNIDMHPTQFDEVSIQIRKSMSKANRNEKNILS
jgi:hypothetical protein